MAPPTAPRTQERRQVVLLRQVGSVLVDMSSTRALKSPNMVDSQTLSGKSWKSVAQLEVQCVWLLQKCIV